MRMAAQSKIKQNSSNRESCMKTGRSFAESNVAINLKKVTMIEFALAETP